MLTSCYAGCLRNNEKTACLSLLIVKAWSVTPLCRRFLARLGQADLKVDCLRSRQAPRGGLSSSVPWTREYYPFDLFIRNSVADAADTSADEAN